MEEHYHHWKTDFIKNKYNDAHKASKRFESEIYFLKKYVKDGTHILDIGCATGGTYLWLKKNIKQSFSYTGIDVSEELIKRAKELSPEAEFISGDLFTGEDILAGRKFDIVMATGVFQHEPRFKELQHIMLELAKQGGHILYDIKLFHLHPTVCDKNIAYGDHGDHKVYYIILNFKDALKFITDEPLAGSHAEFYGYDTEVNFSVHLPKSVQEKVCSTHVLVEKGERKKEEHINFSISLPPAYKI